VNACQGGSLNVLGPVQADAHFGRLWWGGILACFAAGLIVGGLTMLRYQPRRMFLVATFGVLLIAPTLVLLAVPAQAAVIALSAFVTGVGIELFAVLSDTTMQQQIPEQKLSRVYSYDMLGSIALVPVGLAVVGPIADAFGTEATLAGSAIFITLVTLPVFAVRDVRELRRR
jgi:hypothetical protein